MKKLNLIIMTLVAEMSLASSNDGVTQADLKKKERDAINRYITSHKIQKITEAEFEKKGFVTDTTKNEYVLFESTGVYMQIVRKGGGDKLKDGETATELCRYTMYNILAFRRARRQRSYASSCHTHWDKAPLRRTFIRASTNSRLSVADSLIASHLTISTPHHLNPSPSQHNTFLNKYDYDPH